MTTLDDARARLLDVLHKREKRLRATYVKPFTAEELAEAGRAVRALRDELRAKREQNGG